MMCVCQICNEILLDGEAVVVMVSAPFKNLKSAVHYAIGAPTWADPQTLCHQQCYQLENEYFDKEGMQ